MNSRSQAPDVLVVGGSAAGLFTAYLLARGGKKVRLFDANDVLHSDARTLITTSQLTDVLGFFPDDAVTNEINEIRINSRRRSVTIPMREPDLVVERAEIVRLLARKALEAGVQIRGKCKFLKLEAARGGVSITVRDNHRDRIETLTTKTLIGADGTFSRVAKFANGSSHKTTPILQAIVERPADVGLNTTQVWFDPKDTPYFYWMIPESRKQAAAGFITEEGKNSWRTLERFLRLKGLKPLEMQAARIPAYRYWTQPWRRYAGADVYLVGDAAAQVKVTTVGGLVTGLRGAKAAANAVLRGGGYVKELRPLKRELGLHLLIRMALNRFRSADYDRLLGMLNERTVGLLGRYNRDQAARMLCRVLWTQPRLLQFAGFLPGGMWKNLPPLSRLFTALGIGLRDG